MTRPLYRSRRHRCRPEVTPLEGRALLSYAGSPDFTFGTYGLVPYASPGTTSTFDNVASALDSNGKMVVIGDVGTQTGNTFTNYFAAARFNADGSLDTTFGTGGYFTSPLLSSTSGGEYDESANGIAFQSNGDIVLAGVVASSAEVVRLTPNGTLDPTFGTGGIVTLGTYTPNASDNKLDYGASVAILPNGQIAVGGSTLVNNNSLQPAVVRLNANGTIDTTYGTAGMAVVPTATDSAFPGSFDENSSGLVAQANGEVDIVANELGTTTNGIVVTQFTTTGTLDSTYGTGGQELISPEATPAIPFAIGAESLAVQSNGDLVIGGSSAYGVSAIRLNTNGTPDSSFGIGGADILVRPDPYNSGAIAVTIQSDGKILLAEQYQDNVVRLDTDGLPDITFGEGGIASFPTTLEYNGLVGVSELANGQIEAAELVQGQGYGLIRLMTSGAENDFNNDGISDPAIIDNTTGTVTYKPSGGGTAQSDPIGDAGAGLTLPAPGAYAGGGVSEVGVYLPGPGVFEIQPFNGGPVQITAFGTPGIGNALPAPGDYDGSGKTELAIYDPALGAFFYRPAEGGADVKVPLGLVGASQSIPATADYFGTGRDDFAVYLPSEGAYEIMNPVNGAIYNIPFGTPGNGNSIPVPGDYDGSGHAELAVYLPASGDLIYRPYYGGADVTVPLGLPGVAMTIPAIGDYDGAGYDEVAGYEPTTGKLLYQPAAGGPAVSIPLGTPNVTVPFSMGTNAVAEGGIGGSGSPNAIVLTPTVAIPLTSDMLDTIDSPNAKKKPVNG